MFSKVGLGRSGLLAPPSALMLGSFLKVKADPCPLFRWNSSRFSAHVGIGRSIPSPIGPMVSMWWILYGPPLPLLLLSLLCPLSLFPFLLSRHQGIHPKVHDLLPVSQVILLHYSPGSSTLWKASLCQRLSCVLFLIHDA